jgi:hypothetical protein
MSEIEDLAARQLEAYNASDLDAFVACYHPEVRVLEGDAVLCEGLEAFRERYLGLFSAFQFGGEVPQRLAAGPHCVDFERYWRVDPQTQARTEGIVLVQYTERDGLIGTVRFLR